MKCKHCKCELRFAGDDGFCGDNCKIRYYSRQARENTQGLINKELLHD